MYEVHGEGGSIHEGPRNPYPFPPFLTPGRRRHRRAAEEQGLHPSPLPLGLRENCIFCNTCNSFPVQDSREERRGSLRVRPATATRNVTLWVNATARKLITDSSGKTVEAVEIDRGRRRRARLAPLVIVSCGAVNSAALLLRSANDKHPTALPIHPASSASVTWRTWRR
jgi:choline dehydrogenase-like flavoprotein